MTGDDPIRLKDPARSCLESGECSKPYREACSSNCPRYLAAIARNFKGRLQDIGAGLAYITTEDGEERLAFKVSHYPNEHLDGELIRASGNFYRIKPKKRFF
jgi:hypothetical protein